MKIVISLLLLVIVAALLVRSSGLGSLFGIGTSSVKRWCVDQVQMIAADLLGPALTFDDFDYEFPSTITFRKVRLTDGDVVCFEVAAMRFILRDIPVRGKPIVIDTVELTDPIVRLVFRADGTLAGFTNFIKSPAGKKHDDGGSSRPSDFLAIRKMTITNGAFRWRSVDGNAMELDDLEFDLKSQPAADPGSYAFDARLTRTPIIEFITSGHFQLDQLALELSALTLDLVLDDQTVKELPPALQSILAQYEVQGKLNITGSATMPLADPSSAALKVKFTLTDAHLARGHMQIPLDQLTIDLALSNQLLTADAIQAAVFGGHVEGNASLDFDKEMYSELSLTGQGLRLERSLKEIADIESNLAGDVTITGSASVTLTTFPADLDGSGEIAVKDGRLWGNSLFRGLMEHAGQKKADKDYGSTKFALHPHHVSLTKIRVVGGSTAAHGAGEMLFDNRINFRFNAGPLERFTESLGPIGRVLELATDRVLTYHVTGTWSKPEFNVSPLGLGAAPEKDVRPPK